MQFVSTGFAEEIAKGASGRYYYLPNVCVAFSDCCILSCLQRWPTSECRLHPSFSATDTCAETWRHALQASDQAIAMAASSAMAEAKAM